MAAGEPGNNGQETKAAPQPNGTEDRIVKWLDIGAKVLTALAVVGVAVIANSYQGAMTAASLLSKREEADSNLRAAMFHDMIDPVIGAKVASGPSAERSALLVELLALNFHENIELKPLMIDIDRRLKRDKDSAQKNGKQAAVKDLNGAREELRSIARRVRTRQTMMLTRGVHESGAPAAGAVVTAANNLKSGEIRYFSISREGLEPVQDGQPCGVPEKYGQNVCEQDLVITDSPDKTKSLYITLEPSSWTNEAFTVHVVAGARFQLSRKPGDESSKHRVACHTQKSAGKVAMDPMDPQQKFSGWDQVFEITWFDFPLTDNSQLADGTRFAFFLDAVCPWPPGQKANGAARIGLLWFPPDYFPSRERPTNYQSFKEMLKLK